MGKIKLNLIAIKCPNCGSDGIVYSCEPDCCFNHVCAKCLTTFELATTAGDKSPMKSEYLLPDKEVTDPTTDCDACGSIEVYLLDADASNENLVFADCSNLLTLDFVDVQSA